MKTAFIKREDCIGVDYFELMKFLSVEHGFAPKRRIEATCFLHGIMFEQEERVNEKSKQKQ